jgi:phosphatidylinositol alpha-1,6-mannosyltransferase
VLCVSRYTEGRLLERVPWARTGLVPEGVEFERFQRQADESLVPSGRYLLSVGPVKERKGYRVSLEAFIRLKERVPDLQYCIVGMTHDEGFHGELLQMLERAGMADSVHFLGQVPDEQLIALYRGCSLFVLTPLTLDTQFEGFGLIYLEANSCERPVVGARGCGAEEAIVDGETGFLVPPADAGATAAAMEKLLADPDLAARMGASGRERARLMTWDVTAEKLVEEYEAGLSDE